MIAPIQSLAQLQSLSRKNPKYKELAIKTAWELRAAGLEPHYEEAMGYLKAIAREDGEDAVVEEINASRE